MEVSILKIFKGDADMIPQRNKKNNVVLVRSA